VSFRGATPRPLPLLDRARVAAPCSADWDTMVGDARVRFCGACEKNVYNLSAMSRAEAESFVRLREGGVCVRYYRRADGTVLTADCPVGARDRRRRLAVAGAIGSGLVAAATALGGCEQASTTLEYTTTSTSREAIAETSGIAPEARPDAAIDTQPTPTVDASVDGEPSGADPPITCPTPAKDAAAPHHPHPTPHVTRPPHGPTMGLMIMAD
jgi:hypothetical protein